jgi:hypothetical protein
VACILVTPVAAQAPAPATTAFDGTYYGASIAFEESVIDGRSRTHYCPQWRGRPDPLMIVNGIARMGKLEGSVSPQGVLVMRSGGSHFDGRIDSQGAARGRLAGVCSYQLAWQKLPPPTMPFDGDYIGVSRESSGSGAECPPTRVPVTLIIRSSVVTGGSWQGNVNPQGIVVMGNRVARGLTARSTAKASLERKAVTATADVPSHSFGASNPGE